MLTFKMDNKFNKTKNNKLNTKDLNQTNHQLVK